MTTLFSPCVAVLPLINLCLAESNARDISAYVTNTPVLDHVTGILGASADDFAQTLTMTSFCYGLICHPLRLRCRDHTLSSDVR